ncbi:MAG: TonB-dependent receptor [Wenzhouxiangellaceae bacterium]|nr:TonB-dependent receptor [Wenzhouxiangellaceae bacterium]
MQSITLKKLLLSAAIAAVLSPGLALAQDDEDSDSEEQRNENREQTDPYQAVDRIVVSGTPRTSGLRKVEASFSITTATPEDIDDAAPRSTGDLLKIVPGIWVESTGGETGQNIDVRGFPGGSDAPFVTFQIDGSPVFPPPTLSFLENSSLIRLDQTIDHVEVLRGGPSPVFSNGQPGATVNIIQKKGGPDYEALGRVTIGSEGKERFDFFSSGPIARDWYYSVGGFYRDDDGVRDTQFPANKGGQVSATLTHEFGNGDFTLYGRHLDDENVFFTGIPLIVKPGGGIGEFPGFDATDDTLIGNDFRRVSIQVAPGDNPGTIEPDLAEGRGVDLDSFGGTLDLEFGAWRLSDRMNYLDATTPTNGLFTGPTPLTLDSFIESTIAAVNSNPDVLATAGGPATSGTARFFNGGQPVAGDQQVMEAGFWVVDKKVESFTNELRISRELFPGNTLTIGSYFADYEAQDQWHLGNNMLITAEPHARRIDVVLDNGVRVTRQGFSGASFFSLDAAYDGQNIAGFIADEWEFADRWRLDVGARIERQEADGRVSNVFNTDLDGNPLTLHNNSASVPDGTFRQIDFEDTDSSWTAGLNYMLTDRSSVFARVNSGYFFPQFDNLRDGQDNTQEVDQYEIGFKSSTRLYSLFLTGFYNEFEGLPFQVFAEGRNITRIGGSEAKGIEFEARLRPVDGFDIHFTGNWQDAEYEQFGDFSGNKIRRQPDLQFRLTPNLTIPTEYADLRLFATWTHVGDRFSDIENQQPLPSYDTFDIGAVAYIGLNWELRVMATNVTDELALTEGNTRVIGSGVTDNVFLGRPIEGTNVETSLTYRF